MQTSCTGYCKERERNVACRMTADGDKACRLRLQLAWAGTTVLLSMLEMMEHVGMAHSFAWHRPWHCVHVQQHMW